MAITSVEDINRVAMIDKHTFIVNESIKVSIYSAAGTILKEWFEIEGNSAYINNRTESEMVIVNKYARGRNYRKAGGVILGIIGDVLDDLSPTPAQGIANMQVLSEVQSLLKSGYLNVALESLAGLAANDMAGFVGTSFEGDLDSYDLVVNAINEAITEIESRFS